MPAAFIASRSAVIPSFETAATIQYQNTQGNASCGGFLKSFRSWFSARTLFFLSLPPAASSSNEDIPDEARVIIVPVPVLFKNFLLFQCRFIQIILDLHPCTSLFMLLAGRFSKPNI